MEPARLSCVALGVVASLLCTGGCRHMEPDPLIESLGKIDVGEIQIPAHLEGDAARRYSAAVCDQRFSRANELASAKDHLWTELGLRIEPSAVPRLVAIASQPPPWSGITAWDQVAALRALCAMDFPKYRPLVLRKQDQCHEQWLRLRTLHRKLPDKEHDGRRWYPRDVAKRPEFRACPASKRDDDDGWFPTEKMLIGDVMDYPLYARDKCFWMLKDWGAVLDLQRILEVYLGAPKADRASSFSIVQTRAQVMAGAIMGIRPLASDAEKATLARRQIALLRTTTDLEAQVLLIACLPDPDETKLAGDMSQALATIMRILREQRAKGYPDRYLAQLGLNKLISYHFGTEPGLGRQALAYLREIRGDTATLPRPQWESWVRDNFGPFPDLRDQDPEASGQLLDQLFGQ